MPSVVKTIQIRENHSPNLIQVPKAIEMRLDQPNSFIEDKNEEEFNIKLGKKIVINKFYIFNIFIIIKFLSVN